MNICLAYEQRENRICNNSHHSQVFNLLDFLEWEIWQNNLGSKTYCSSVNVSFIRNASASALAPLGPTWLFERLWPVIVRLRSGVTSRDTCEWRRLITTHFSTLKDMFTFDASASILAPSLLIPFQPILFFNSDVSYDNVWCFCCICNSALGKIMNNNFTLMIPMMCSLSMPLQENQHLHSQYYSTVG